MLKEFSTASDLVFYNGTPFRENENAVVGGFHLEVLAVKQYKRRMHIVGRVVYTKQPDEPDQPEEFLEEPFPFESFVEIGEEWTDGYECEVEHGLMCDTQDEADAIREDIEHGWPNIVWGDNQKYGTKITKELKELVKNVGL